MLGKNSKYECIMIICIFCNSAVIRRVRKKQIQVQIQWWHPVHECNMYLLQYASANNISSFKFEKKQCDEVLNIADQGAVIHVLVIVGQTTSCFSCASF